MKIFTNFSSRHLHNDALPRSHRLNRLPALLISFFASVLLLVSGKAISQSADLDQGENGSATSPKTIFWQNGNLGPSGAHFAEGYSIPYRMKVAGLTGGLNAVHTLVIEWDTKDQNGHALDYITHYDILDNPVGSHMANFGHAQEAVNPLLNPTTGTTYNFNDSIEVQIPTPSSVGAEIAGMPGASFLALPGAARTNRSNATKMVFWGANTITLTYGNQDNQDATTASTKSRLTITFKSDNGTTALVAWGGHIAAEYDWGLGRGASKVNGSPYHMRLVSIDGKPGSQDRSLKASAVFVPPPSCTAPAAQTACEGSTTTMTYSVTPIVGVTNYTWTLTPSTTNAKFDGSATNTVSGANLTSVNIVPNLAGGFTTGTYTLSLSVTNLGGNSAPCSTTGTINPKATSDAGPDQTVCATSPTVTLAGSVGGGATSGTWSGGLGTFNPNATTLNATYTPTAAEITAGTVTLTLTTNDPTGPCAAVTNDMIITINPAATADAGPDQDVCASSPTVTLAGSVGGGASSGTWSGGTGVFNPNANTLTATYTPSAAEITAGTVTLTLTTNDPTGPCGTATNDMVINITANPSRPNVVYIAPDCDEDKFAVKVIGAVAGGTYTLTQVNGVGTVVKTTAADKDADNNILFAGLTIGKGFSIVLTVGDCTSGPTDCDNYKDEIISIKKPITRAAATEVVTGSKVTVAPNPFNDKIRFSFTPKVTGRASLDLYNLLGEKVKTVFTGQVQKGQTQIIEYNVPFSQRTTLIYMFRVGNEKVSGKLIGLR